MRSTLHLAPAVCVAALILSTAAPSRATILVEVPIEDMAVDADEILVGEVVRTGTQMMFQEGAMSPWTVTTIRVMRWLKGEGSEQFVIYERGGEWQGGGMRIEGTPEYRVGERVLVFTEHDILGRPRTYGMVQGKFVIRAAVDGPTLVERSLHGVGFARWSSQGMRVEEAHESPRMTFDDLMRRIDDALQVLR